MFLTLYPIKWPNLIVWLPLFVRYLAICDNFLFFWRGEGAGLLTEDFKDKLDIDLKIFLSMVYLAHLLNWYKQSETVLRFLLDKD